MNDYRVWLAGLISAAANGLAATLAIYVAAPEASATVIIKSTLIATILGVANYLIRSPLPSTKESDDR